MASTPPLDTSGTGPPGSESAPDSEKPRHSEQPRPGRRSMLVHATSALTAAGLVAGCSDDQPSARQRRRSEMALELRREAADDSATLLARYGATVAAHPALATRLAPLRDAVSRHLTALGDSRDGEGAKHASGAGGDQHGRSSEGPEGSGHGTASVPADEDGALAALAGAERRTSEARTRALVDAPPELARLLASMAACGATHSFLLTESDA